MATAKGPTRANLLEVGQAAWPLDFIQVRTS